MPTGSHIVTAPVVTSCRLAVALIDFEAREIHAKIVYFGPELSGKTTTLRAIAAGVPPETCGNFRAIASESARTIFSDSLMIDFGTRLGFRLHWHLYSVPGQRRSSGPRAVVLHGADGVVFVADADAITDGGEPGLTGGAARSCWPTNPRTWRSSRLYWNAISPISRTRCLVPEIAAILKIPESNVFRASAIQGEGVFEALRDVSRQVAASL